MDFKKINADYVEFFNNSLDEYLEKSLTNAPNNLKDAMKYAVLDGGKRVRPVLCFATAKMLGVDPKKVLNYAFAIEFIHSYSLVHDDLPSMDNDDYRRGKLSTHKKFGEAIGVLCGDALLNFAMETCLKTENINSFDIKAIKIIFDYAGAFGMIKGQVYDLENEGNADVDEEVLYNIYLYKTAKLLTAPLLVASCVAGNKYFNELKIFGENLGYLFQITDDILDVEGSFSEIGKTPNKDEAVDKCTAIRLFGLDGAKEKAKYHYDICKEIIKKIPNSEFLSEFTDLMYLRKK